MVGAQREANRPRRADLGAASAHRRCPWATLVPFVVLGLMPAAGRGQASVAGVTDPRTHPLAIGLPKHVRGDTGKVAGTRALHGDARIDEGPPGPSPEERVVVPAKLLEEAGIKLLRRVRIRVGHGLDHLAAVGRPNDASAGRDERPPMTAESEVAAEVEPVFATVAPPAPASPALALAPAAVPAQRPLGAVALVPAPPVAAPSVEMPPAGSVETITLEADVFGRIRLEIKSRLPFFQACADAARRRGAPDVRRLQATWIIADDGSIKELKLEGATDAQLAGCIARMGSRRFPVSPGTELTIPTPIVFVR